MEVVGYSDYQMEVVALITNIGLCVQFALIMFACFIAVLTVKALW